MADAITRQVGDESEQTWVFDYFTDHALHKEPASGRYYVPANDDAKTRSESVVVNGAAVSIVICVDEYGGIGYEGQDSYVKIGEHCSTTVILGDIIYDNGNGGGSGSFSMNPDGGGGGVGTNSNSTQQNLVKADITQQIEDKLKNCGFAAVMKDIGGLDKLNIVTDNKLDGKSGQYNPIKKTDNITR